MYRFFWRLPCVLILILYISAFYGSGKTVLLDQTAVVAAEE